MITPTTQKQLACFGLYESNMEIHFNVKIFFLSKINDLLQRLQFWRDPMYSCSYIRIGNGTHMGGTGDFVKFETNISVIF